MTFPLRVIAASPYPQFEPYAYAIRVESGAQPIPEMNEFGLTQSTIGVATPPAAGTTHRCAVPGPPMKAIHCPSARERRVVRGREIAIREVDAGAGREVRDPDVQRSSHRVRLRVRDPGPGP